MGHLSVKCPPKKKDKQKEPQLERKSKTDSAFVRHIGRRKRNKAKRRGTNKEAYHSSSETPDKLHTYEANRRTKFQVGYKFAKQKKQATHQRQTDDLNSTKISFNKGDWVFMFTPVARTTIRRKIKFRRKGPYQVLEKMTDVTGKVDFGKSTLHIHTDRLKGMSDTVEANTITNESKFFSDIL